MNEETQETTTELVPQDGQQIGVVTGPMELPVVGEAGLQPPMGEPSEESEESPF